MATSSSTTSAAEVSLLSRTPVFCAHETSLTGLEDPYRLGPLDQLLHPFVPIAVVFVYQNPVQHKESSNTEFIPVSRLQKAFSLLLDYYPHLTGRLQLNSSDKAPEIGHLGSGAEILSATCSATLNSFRSSADARLQVTDLPDGGNALLAPYIPDFEQICKNPVFTIQHTRFACGGVSLGIRISHILCDGDGYFQLVRDLAELYRGLRASEFTTSGASSNLQLTHPPHIKGYLAAINMSPQECEEALQYKPWLYQLIPQPLAAPAEVEAPPLVRPPVTGRILRFTTTELDAIKAQATDKTALDYVTTFDSLAAHLHQRIYAARIQNAKSTGASEINLSTEFLAPVSWRGADRFNLPKRFFSNAGIATFFPIPAEKLINSTLPQIAQAVHEGVRKVTKEDAEKTLRWIAAQPDKSKILPGFRLDKSIFMASQWSKFEMYKGTDLDVQPELVQPPFTVISLVDGLTYFLATEDQLKNLQGASRFSGNQESLDVAMALSDPLWKFLDQDPLFRQFQPSQ